VYDAVAGQTYQDRFINSSLVIKTTGKRRALRPNPPETILASRWRRQRKRNRNGDLIENDDEEDDVKMMKAGLVVPSHRNEALPDSVFHMVIYLI
jgi:hypothetical protein